MRQSRLPNNTTFECYGKARKSGRSGQVRDPRLSSNSRLWIARAEDIRTGNTFTLL
jgi:hypothetical protein